MPVKNLLRKERNTEFHFFSGKGGVGKTSCSAATAVHFANNGRKVLIVSVDPAHSLSDSFGLKIGGDVKQVDKNLFAVEIDPAKSMEEYKQKLAAHLDNPMLQGLGLGDSFDIAGMTPGIDEVAAFDKFLQYMQNKEYDAIIFDTAPTGHALRFLSLPDVLDSWLGKMIALKLRFSGLTNLVKRFMPGSESDGKKEFGGKELEKMKERIKMAKEVLSDPKKTHFNLVLIPEAMSILESERSLVVLKEYNIPVENVIVNQILPDNKSCGFCFGRRRQQLKRLEEIKKKFKSQKIRVLEQFKEEVRGPAMLRKVAKGLYD